MKTLRISSTLLLFSALIPLLTGCASVMCGSKQAVAIDSRPRAAEVLIYNANCQVIFRSTTPCIANLNRFIDNGEKGHYVVLIKKDGFASVQIPIGGKVNSAYYLNILNAGIGYFIDPMTGSMWTLVPEPKESDLVKNKAGFFAEDGLFIDLKQDNTPKVAAPQKKPTPAPTTAALTQASVH